MPMMLSTVCRVYSRLRPSWLRLSDPFGRVNLHGRCFQLSSVQFATDGEKAITTLLTDKLKPTFVAVRDISGGCGSMYEIWIDSEHFKGKRLLQQHKMVNEALGEEIKALHGLTIRIGNPNESKT